MFFRRKYFLKNPIFFITVIRKESTKLVAGQSGLLNAADLVNKFFCLKNSKRGRISITVKTYLDRTVLDPFVANDLAKEFPEGNRAFYLFLLI